MAEDDTDQLVDGTYAGAMTDFAQHWQEFLDKEPSLQRRESTEDMVMWFAEKRVMPVDLLGWGWKQIELFLNGAQEEADYPDGPALNLAVYIKKCWRSR